MASRDRSSKAATERSAAADAMLHAGDRRMREFETVADLFARQVRDRPSQKALILATSSLTFDDLDRKANRVARYLIGRGIGPGDIVALGCASGPDLVVCLLGVIKAGACYMPLDPAYPDQRLTDMLADAAPDLILAEPAVAGVVEAAGQTDRSVLIGSGAFGREISLQAAHALEEGELKRPPSANDPAYLVYTSGSTGRPKGVLGRQAALVNRLRWIGEALPFAQDERTLFKTSLNFIDGSTELLGALTNGGSVVIADGHVSGDPRRLAETVDRFAVTRLTVVPSLLASLLEDGCLKNLAGCRTWVTSGEPLPSSLLERFSDKLPGARLYNFYGASEAAGDSLWSLCEAGQTVAIGNPVRETLVHLLDDRLQPVEDGNSGELYIGGSGLALGYHRQPDRTSERFIASPFGPPGSLLYRTGDVARRLPGGAFEYLGRTDHQVKIRGVRVEPGEVAAALDRLPELARSAVVSRHRDTGEVCLVAYIVWETGAKRDIPKLLETLARSLPAAFLPSQFITLEALPLTPNGKLDRAALPEPDREPQEDRREPRTALETTICALFTEVLGVGTVAADDNFFLLGGHSLLAARLAYRLRERLGVHIDPVQVFEAPTPAGLAALAGDAKPWSKDPGKPPRPERPPLSSAQKRLWFLNRLHPEDISYNLAYRYRLAGNLDIATLRQAWRDVIDRHEILRTVYPEGQDGKPYQDVSNGWPDEKVFRILPTSAEDLSAVLCAHAALPFDLGSDLPIRICIVPGSQAESGGQHVMQFVVHHIAIDGGALGPLLADLETAFLARSQGKTPRWNAPAMQYADFACWQQERLGRISETDIAQHLSGWKADLAGAPDCLDLPCADGRRQNNHWQGDGTPVDIPARLHGDLERLAAETQTSLFMVLQAAVAATMARLGAGDDIIIGTPVDGRPDRSFEDTVGLFVNMLALRCDLSGQPTFRDLLAATRTRNLRAYGRRDVPFELVVDELAPNRDLSFHPLFQLVLALDMGGVPDLALPGLTCVHEEVPVTASKFDLSFDLAALRGPDGSASGIRGRIEFRTDLLDRQIAETISRRLVVLLEAAVDHPDVRIAELPLVASGELARLAGLCEGSRINRPEVETSLPERFALLTERNGERIAVRSETEALSYADLDARTTLVARNLAARGVRPGARVAVLMDRSIDLVVATLAILKAGGAYVPLNRNDPQKRLEQLVGDTRAHLVLTDGGAADPGHLGGVSCLSFADLMSADSDAALPRVEAGEIACVLFTSGSTGRPKGIAITHRNIQALALDGCWPDGSHERVLLHSPYAFDASTYELWTPLMRGQELLVAPPGILDAETIGRLVKDNKVTAACITTRLFNIIAGEKPEAFRPLKSVLIGGEAASAEALRRATSAAPETRFVNGYGPAEGTTFVTWHAMHSLSESAHKVPIGLPRDNCAVRILDDRLQPVGIGMVGELYLTGDCLTLGYLDRAGLTAERFVADPSGPPGSRMYRTGDLVRWRGDGLLTFVGRADHQVKINGFRIEPQEIENAIGGNPAVGQCAVIVREDRPGEKKLVAYLVSAGTREPDLETLRGDLASSLPAFMVPAHFVVLQSLPFTTNGKLDLKRLPAPDVRGETMPRAASGTEAEICRLFADVLGLASVGPADNFFALGGDSILSIQLVSRARRAGLVFSAKDIFNARTPAQLALRAREQQVQEAETGLEANWICEQDLARVNRRYGSSVSAVWPLTGLQSGLLFHGLMDAATGEDAYLVQTVVTLAEPVEADRLQASLEALVARHAPLRAVFCHEGVSEPVQVILADPNLPFRVVDLSRSDDPQAALESLLAEDRRTRFDLARGPLIRACLVRLPGERSKLILTNHHILLDGWSLPVLMRELKDIHAAGGAHALPAVVPFDRYLGWLQRQDRAAARTAWQEALAGLEEPTRLAASVHGQPAAVSDEVLRFDTLLSPQATRALERLARQLDITLNTVLQGAWAVLLGRICGREDLVFGTTVSGRPPEIAGVETMAGLFINTVPVRARPLPGQTVEAFLKELQARQTALLPHQHLGLPEIQAGAGLGDLFDTLVVFENYPDAEDMGGAGETGLRIDGLEVHDRTHYPASLMVVPGDQLMLRLDCREDRIGSELGRSLLDQLCHLLDQMALRPDAALGSLATLEPTQTQAVQERWNDTRHALPEGDLVELISATAARHTEREAVVGGEERLSYRQLEERANRLAHVLLRHGIGAEDRVAIALPRSPDMVVALLAVLKTGGAYLPLDPDYPPARIAMMLEDAAPKLVITTEKTKAALKDGLHGLDLLVLDAKETATELDNAPARAPQDTDRRSPIHPNHPAYVIYTSGSTGKPKGVVVTRAGLVNLATAQVERFAISADSRVAQFASFSFDAAFSEIATALVSGAALVIWPRKAFTDPAALKAFLRDEDVSHITLSPSLLSVMSVEDLPAGCVLVTAGEAISIAEVRRWAERCRLINAYGPTEVTVCGSMSLPLDGDQGADVASIGLPIWNSGLYVLDRALQPVADGVAGELYIGGIGLARGYQNLAGLTASRFVADPFAGDGARMYRTGDIVYRAGGGNLFFLGRGDSQVKIRGRRIEPGEIERVLLERDDVAQCLVSVYRDRTGTSRLVAYVIGQDNADPCPDALKQHCAGRLPDYMVPVQIDLLPYLPRLPNGKIDRKALPAPSRPHREPGARTLSPLEETVSAAFAETLGIAAPAADQSFFALGGDSISAIKLVSLLRRQGLSASPKDVFDHKTVAGLAAVVQPLAETDDLQNGDAETGTVHPTPIMRWLEDLGGPLDGFYQSTCLQLPAGAGAAFLEAALAALVRHHGMLRVQSGRGLQDMHVRPFSEGPQPVDLRRVDLTGTGSDTDLRLLLQEMHDEATGTLSLADGRMLNAVWFDRGDTGPGWLLLAAHHLVIDGVSWRILTDDLRSAWEDWSAGRPISLEPATTSFPVWSRLLRNAAHSAARSTEVTYWREVAAAGTAGLVPGRLDPTLDTVRTQTSRRSDLAPAETARLLNRLPALYGCGPQDVLLSALTLAVGAFLSARSGASAGDVLCEVEGHGREPVADADLSRTVGWFTSLYPVRLQTGQAGPDVAAISDQDLRLLIAATKDGARTMPDRGIGYGMLRYLNEETAGTLAKEPKAQISFNYLGRFQAEAGGDWSPVPEFGGLRGGFHPATPLDHVLSIDCQAVEEDDGFRLVTDFSPAARHLPEGDVAELLQHWERALARLASHADWQDAGGHTPSDFPLADLSQAEVDLLSERYGDAVSAVWPLTGLQSGLLFHGLMDAETGEDAYLVQTVVTLAGDVEADRLQASLEALVARHAPLRAVFCHEGVSEPVQVILTDPDMPFQVVDLSGSDAPQAALESLLAEDRRTRFDLARGPLLRACLVRLPGERSKLILTNHHILLDGWSLPVLMRELKDIHAAGGPHALPAVVPFDRYLGWLQRQDRAAARTAWQEALAGLEEPTRLAASVHGQPSAVSDEVLRFDTLLSPEATCALERLARQLDITLNTVLQGAWAVLLGRVCGRDDLVFGTTVSGRPPEITGVETMAGLFINTVPVRARPLPGQTVEAFLKGLQGMQASLLPHQHLGLPEIQAGAGLGDLFDTLVVFENYPDAEDMGRAGETGLRIDGLEVHDRTHYPASLMVVPGDQLMLRLDCREDRIGSELGRSLLEQLCHLLEQMALQPDAALGSLATLGPAQTQAVQERWNDTRHALPEGDLVELISATAARHGEREAVVSGEERLSYRQLEERANRLAHVLLRHGIGAEDRVAIALPRSADMVVALLAVLKTGGAYLPLDPDYPPARIAMMLEDAAPKLVITTEKTKAALKDGLHGLDLLVLDAGETAADLDNAPAHVPQDTDRRTPIHPNHPAYVIYTSGSTGKPKGVVVTRAGLKNFLCGLTQDLELTDRDRMLSATTIGFDIAGLELYGPLLTGGTVLLFAASQRETDRLSDWIALEHPTVMQATPSLWRALAETGPLPNLKVLVGGEALDGVLAERLRSAGPVTNLYGPTETTIWSLRQNIDQAASNRPGIGLPMWNTQAHVLDAALQPVADGVAGELYIGGTGLARGYHGRPDLTSERFVADPFAGGGARMYRTGDIVYRNADGTMVFLGRGDAQLKIRGHRIEPGEIETVIASMTNVARAAVIERQGAGPEPSLVAYVVPEPGARLKPEAIRTCLQQSLPDYMVPGDFVVLDEMPLTPNGKLNRLALPEPVRVRRSTEAMTLQETLLCTLFAEVLQGAMPGPQDSFFEMGGHSLQAARLKSLMRDRMGLDVSLRDIFETPTVRGLLSTGRDRKTCLLEPVLQIRPAGSQPPLFCVHPGFGLGWTYAGLVSVLPPDVPVIALQARGYADEAALPASIGDMAADYMDSVVRLWPKGPVRLLGWSFGGLAAYEMAHRFEAAGREVEFLSLLDSYPMKAGDPLPDLSDRGARGAFFEMVGFDPQGRSPDDVTFEEVRRFLEDRSHPLADLGSGDFGNMLRIARNNARLAHDWRPQGLTCPLLHFVSGQSWRMMALETDPWQPLTGGRFETRTLACTHHEMTSQIALADIGKALSEWMNQGPLPRRQDASEGRLKNVG
ncbi:non-ribosomal peptide synthetase [Roseibium sp. Sym1]|uniref:non-ribosomal peptide synthetase n=1 Tax=Roseibium sp. Sym1 TaxID=3016006 RepID=UPI0022B44865|nr:non-ribosomal peptide synthetase [Roseibium sp. Sym1]